MVGATWPCSNATPFARYAGELMKLKADNHLSAIVSRQVADALTVDSTKVGSAAVARE